jgi:tRNA(fMet)-specific endonuclease VapC
LRVIYDTNILLQILRSPGSMENLQARFGSEYIEEYISIVTVAEIRSLAVQFCWGDTRLCKMKELLEELPSIDINTPSVLDLYVEIDCYSKRKHATLVGDFSAIKMGKNDLWIAATASAYQCSLLTMDLDFRHLHEEFLDVIYIDSFT